MGCTGCHQPYRQGWHQLCPASGVRVRQRIGATYKEELGSENSIWNCKICSSSQQCPSFLVSSSVKFSLWWNQFGSGLMVLLILSAERLLIGEKGTDSHAYSVFVKDRGTHTGVCVCVCTERVWNLYIYKSQWLHLDNRIRRWFSFLCFLIVILRAKIAV